MRKLVKGENEVGGARLWLHDPLVERMTGMRILYSWIDDLWNLESGI
jgi:hypothetical protein